MKLPNSSTMASTQQSQIPLQNLSIQAKHAYISPKIYSSLISIGKLCDNECTVTFEKHRFIVRKINENIIEGYQDPMHGSWHVPLHSTAQSKQQYNMKEYITSKHCFQHIKTIAPQYPREYHPKGQQYLTIFYNQILF